MLILIIKFYYIHAYSLSPPLLNGFQWFNKSSVLFPFFLLCRDIALAILLHPTHFNPKLLPKHEDDVNYFELLLISKSSHYILLHNAFAFHSFIRSFVRSKLSSSLGFHCCCSNSVVGLSIAVIKTVVIKIYWIERFYALDFHRDSCDMGREGKKGEVGRGKDRHMVVVWIEVFFRWNRTLDLIFVKELNFLGETLLDFEMWEMKEFS